MTRNNADFHSLEFQLLSNHPTSHVLEATSPAVGDFVGGMRWDKETGQVHDVGVDHPYRRKGIATALWNHAVKLASEDASIAMPKHSPVQTPSGKAWVESLGK